MWSSIMVVCFLQPDVASSMWVKGRKAEFNQGWDILWVKQVDGENKRELQCEAVIMVLEHGFKCEEEGEKNTRGESKKYKEQ